MILRPIFEKLFKFREAATRKNRAPVGADEGFDPHEKPFLDHLEDLRHTLMKVIVALVITTILGFVFHEKIFHFMLKPLTLAKFEDVDGNVTSTLADHVRFIVLSPPEILMLSIKVSFLAGLIGAFPLLVFFIGEFVLPGLRQQEKKLIIPGIGAGFFLFLVGASFAFFLATPIAMKFFHEFEMGRISFTQPNVDAEKKFLPIRRSGKEATVTAADALSGGADALGTESKPEGGAEPEGDDKPEPEAEPDSPPALAATELKLSEEQQENIREYLLQLIVIEQGSEVSVTFEEDIGKIAISTGIREKSQYRIGEYISFVTRLILVFGLSFQLPVVVTILSKLQLLTAQVMRNTRAFAWVIMLVLSAIFTPPDVFTLGLLAGPLILLYEICIWIAWSIESKREKTQRAEEEEERQRLEALYSKPAEDLSEEEKAEIHRREIEQYEREHEHLHDDHFHDDDHDHDHHHGDPDHSGIKPDPHSIGYDPSHDESWDDDHDEHGNPYHNDPYHGDDPEHHDPHENTEAHEPIQDWPDREDEDSNKGKSDSDDSESTALESDHAEPSGEDGDAAPDTAKAENSSEDNDNDNEPCAPSGAIINPNIATLEELTTLPGVDEELADHMILYRPFNNFDELLEVPGMDDDILNAIIDRLNLE